MEIQLNQDSGVPSVALIQMPNGTGKTTILNLIRAAMTGLAEKLSPKEVKRLQRSEDSKSEGKFTLFLNVDGRALTFEMRFDFIEGSVRYRTTHAGSGGIRSGWDPPSNVRRFLNEQFVGLYVFDGELAERLLDSTKSEAEKAIDALCQLYLLDMIREQANENWERVTQGKPKTGTGLTKWQNNLETYEKYLGHLLKEEEKANKELLIINKEISHLEKELGELISSEKNAASELEEKKRIEQSARENLTKSTDQVMTLIRQPHALHEAFRQSLIQVKENFDRLKLPESTSRQFFLELLEEENCICGRPLDDETKKNIGAHADEYLGKEISGVLNTLKQDIDLYLLQGGTPTPEILSQSVEQLKIDSKGFDLAKSAVRALESELVKKSDDDTRRKGELLEEKKRTEEKITADLEELNRPAKDSDDEHSRCILALKNLVKTARKKVDEIQGTVELGERTEILKDIIENIKNQARDNIRRALITDCNNRLKTILSREPIQIEHIGNSLVLRNQEGASVGQTLSVGYTFLTTLLNRGQHKFPLIVDSPANPLDANVRREIGSLVPELCDQFVALTISTEREGFVPALDKKSKGNIKYITVFRKTPGTAHLLKLLPKKGVTQTQNSVVIEGKEYFDQFDIE
jgi:DNA sulfur modification protein DndD